MPQTSPHCSVPFLRVIRLQRLHVYILEVLVTLARFLPQSLLVREVETCGLWFEFLTRQVWGWSRMRSANCANVKEGRQSQSRTVCATIITQ